MAISVLNFTVLDEAATPTASSFNYTPVSGCNAVLAVMVSKIKSMENALPAAPTFGGTNMVLLHRASWPNSTEGYFVAEIWYINTTTTSSTAIAHSAASDRPFYLAGVTLDKAIGGVLQPAWDRNAYYVGSLPDGSVQHSTISLEHSSDDRAFAIFPTANGSISGWTNVDDPSVTDFTNGSLRASLFHLGYSSAGTASVTTSYDSFGRDREVFAVSLTANAVDSLVIDEYVQGRIFPRDDKANNTADITVSGAYFGSPTAIQVRVLNYEDDTEALTWATVDASPSGGTWSGTLANVPLGGMYKLEARFSNDTGVTVKSICQFGVGVIVLMYGQSNASKYGDISTINELGTRDIFSPGIVTDRNHNDDLNCFASTALAAGIYESLFVDNGIPAIVYANGVAATPIANLLKAHAGTNWEDIVEAFIDKVGGCDFFLWQHGMANIATTTTLADYLADMREMHSDLATYLSQTTANTPYIVGSVNRSYEAYADANVEAIRNAQVQMGGDAGAYYSHSSLQLQLSDSLHMNEDVAAGNTLGAKWYGLTIASILGLTDAPNWQIASGLKVNDTTIDLTVTHSLGTDFTPTSGIEGFEVSNDESSWSAATAVRQDATTIRLTHASDSSDPMYVRYLYGEDPNTDTNNAVTTMVRDNSTYAIPLNFTTTNVTASGPAGPTVSTATVNSAGTTLTLVFSESVTTDYTGFDVDGWTLSGGSGSGSDTIVFTISQVYSDESPALDYASATGNVTGVTSGEPLGDLTDDTITNSSSVSPNPTVTTGAASSVSFTTATVAGEVTSEGRESVTERGVVWHTSTGPTIANNKATAGTGSGSFSANLTSMPDDTLIYFRAYATNASGTSYGAEDTFTTLDDPVPTVTSIRFDDDGTRIRISFSEAVTGTTGFSTNDGTITYASGSGTSSYLFSFTGSPTTVSYTPGNVEDSLSQALGSFSNTTIDPELIATSSDTAVASVAKSVVGSVSGSVTG